jgi:hydroxymethylbilane synthase
MTKLVLATRKSPLALAQTEMVAAHLRTHLGVETELLKIVTTGDKQTEWSLEKRAARDSSPANSRPRSCAARPMSPCTAPRICRAICLPGLALGGYMPRADTRDVLVLHAGVTTPQTIATASPRRRLQISKLFPEATFTEIRGNVDTRLRKIGELHVADATVLAAAGLKRLGISRPGRGWSLCRWSSTRWCPPWGRVRLASNAARPTPRNSPQCSMRPRRAMSRSSARFKTHWAADVTRHLPRT